MSTPALQTILYVEDDLDIQEVTRFALERIGGYRVRLAQSGPQAIVMAGQDPPDLLLIDVMMPDMDGPTTLEHLRRDPRLASTPVIFITASVASQEVRQLRSLGAIEVIAKPFDPIELSGMIAQAWSAAH